MIVHFTHQKHTQLNIIYRESYKLVKTGAAKNLGRYNNNSTMMNKVSNVFVLLWLKN